MNISEPVKEWRARANLTQKQAALALGLPVSTYQAIEQGRIVFKYAKTLLLAIECMERRGYGS